MQPTQNPVDMTEPVSRALRDAVLYLSRHGWCQGAYFDQTATVFTPAACTVGAIGMVCYGGPVEAPAEMVGEPGFGDFETALTYLDWCLADWFGDGPDGGPMNAYSFNDARGRTVDEVVAVLRAAASMWDLAGAGVHHADYPHTPGTLYDCPLCESMCFCATAEQPCVYCAIQAELSAEDAATETYLSACGDTNGGAA